MKIDPIFSIGVKYYKYGNIDSWTPDGSHQIAMSRVSTPKYGVKVDKIVLIHNNNIQK